MPRLLPALLALAALALPPAARALARDEMVKMLEIVDDRQRNSGDYKALAYIEQKEKDQNDLVYEAVIYRRDADDKLMILFLQPKSEAGKGYLRIDKNLWLYDPSVGKWERRTEREKIGGTDSRRADFDESRLAIEYEPEYVGAEKLGKLDVQHLKLTVKPGVDVAYPILHLWIDAENNVRKAQELALSGRLMRTTYYPKWEKMYSPSKGADILYPKEIRIFDEVEKGNSAVILLRQVDLASLPANIFTKAWLESKSR